MVFRYILNGESLRLDREACTGCGACVEVCPHAVFAVEARKARITDPYLCMECGACALNCPAGAIEVKAGVGCASAIIRGKLRGTVPDCGCGSGPCCG
jgi:NAD-dependent dihydropyrimidine dehydrogenase PreA subunit